MDPKIVSVVLSALLVCVAGTAVAAPAVGSADRAGVAQQQGTNATVTVENQTSNGTTVTVDAATLPDGGFVVMHNALSLEEGGPVESVVGSSAYLEPGTHENVTVRLNESGTAANATVTLEETLRNGTGLVAMAHRDTDGDRNLTFVESNGTTDGPYTVNGTAVTDEAFVTLEADNGTATATPAATGGQ